MTPEILSPKFEDPIESIIAMHDGGVSPFSPGGLYPYNLPDEKYKFEPELIELLGYLPQMYRETGLNIEEDERVRAFFELREINSAENDHPITWAEFTETAIYIQNASDLHAFLKLREDEIAYIQTCKDENKEPSFDQPITWTEFAERYYQDRPDTSKKHKWLNDLQSKSRQRLIFEMRAGIHPLYPGIKFTHRQLKNFFGVSFQRIALIDQEVQEKLDLAYKKIKKKEDNNL